MQLTILTINRLVHQPELFVLERRRMEALGAEKEFNDGDSAFWNGRYVLDGIIDRDGYRKDTVTINARLIPPDGGQPIAIDIAGSRTICNK